VLPGAYTFSMNFQNKNSKSPALKVLKELLFLKRSWPIRIWMWAAILSLIVFLTKHMLSLSGLNALFEMVLLAFGLGSLAMYVLVYGFDWS
jgi:hypothetical protein